MSEQDPQPNEPDAPAPKPKAKRTLWSNVAWFVFGIVPLLLASLLVIGGIWLSNGAPGGITAVARFLEGRRVDRFGNLSLEGVTETKTGATIARATLSDAKGVWVEVKEATLVWNPKALMQRRVDISRIDAAQATVLRVPILTPKRPPKPQHVDVDIAAIKTNLRLVQGLIPNLAQINQITTGQLAFKRDRSVVVNLRSVSSSGPQDLILVDISRQQRKPVRILINAQGGQNGVVNSLLGGPGEAQTKLNLSILGDLRSGQASGKLTSGDQSLAVLNGNWSLQNGVARGFLAPHPASYVGARMARLGGRVETDASAGRLRGNARDVNLVLRAPAIETTLTGNVDFQAVTLKRGGQLLLNRADLALLSKGRVAGIATGQFDLEGRRVGSRLMGTAQGEINIPRVTGFGVGINAVRIPVKVDAQTSKLTIEAQSEGQLDARALDPRIAKLGTAPKLNLSIEQDRSTAIWSMKKAQLAGKIIQIDATGRWGGEARELVARANLTDVNALIPLLSGQASVDVDLRQSGDRAWQGKATVKASRLGSRSEIIERLVGDQLTAEITPAFTSPTNQFTWQARTKTGTAQGTYDFQNQVPFRGQWSFKAPLVLPGVTLSGQNNRGPVGDVAIGPAGLAVASQGGKVAIGGWTVTDASILAVGGLGSRPLLTSVEGIAPLGPAKVTASIVNTGGVVYVNDVQGRHAGLLATGQGRNANNMFDGLFDLTLEPGAVLVSGASAGKLGVAVRQGKVGVVGDLGLTNAAFRGLPVQVPQGRLRVSGLLGDLSLSFIGDVRSGARLGQVSLTGKADLDGRDTNLILSGSGSMDGRAFTLTKPFHASPLGANARLAGEGQWGDYRLGLDGQIAGGGLDLRFVDLEGPGVSARLSGRLGGGAYTLRGKGRASNLAQFNNRLEGSAQGDLIIAGGTTQGWSVQAKGEAKQFSVGLPDFDKLLGSNPRFDLAARALPGQVMAGAWSLDGKQLSGRGLVGPPSDGRISNLSGTWTVTGPVTLGGVEIDGQVGGNISLQGSLLDVTAATPSLKIAGQNWSDLRAKTQIADVFALSAIPVQGNGVGALGPIKFDTVFVTGNRPMLQPLSVTYGGIEANGALAIGEGGPAGTLNLQGSLGAFMTSGSANGFVRLSPGASGPNIDTRLSLSNVSLAQAGVAGLNGNVTASGPLKDLRGSMNANFAISGQPASARLVGSFTQNGGANNIRVSGDGTYQGAPWRLLEPLSLSMQDQATRGRGQIVWREADLEFDGNVSTRGVAITAELKNAPAALFARGQAAPLDGRVSGTVRLNGRDQNFNGEGQLQAVGLKPRGTAAQEAINGEINANLANGVMTLRGSATNAGGLRATGDARLLVSTGLSPFRLEIVRSGALAGGFEVDGPVDALAKIALSRNSRASGRISAQGRLSGTFGNPSIEGRADIKDASLRDPSLGIRLTDANAAISFLGPIADIQTLSASDGRGGKLELGGRIVLGHDANWRLQGQMNDFQLIDSTDALIIATGPWSLASQGGQMTLGGELLLNNARISQRLGGARGDALAVREVNRPASLGPAPNSAPAPSNTAANTNQRAARGASNRDLRLDLRLTSNGNARVISTGFDGVFDLNVGVRGTIKQPQVTGLAELTRGRFDLAGRNFEMTRGRVRFQSPLAASQIDFVAERDTADLTALAKIQGSIGRPVFRLESTPASPQDEILSRILFGRNVAALSLTQAAQLALGLSSLTTGNQLDPTVRLAQALGLERFSLGTDSGGIGGFTAGMRLARDVYVEVTTGGEDGTITMLEWRPRRRVQVQVTTSQKRESSVSVRVKSKD